VGCRAVRAQRRRPCRSRRRTQHIGRIVRRACPRRRRGQSAPAFHVARSAWLKQNGTIGLEIPRGWHGSTWGTIYRPLRAVFPSALYHAGKAVERVEQNGTKVTAIFADGTRAHGDLLIAADGIYSTVRKQILPDIAPTQAGYIAWRGILDERDLPEEAHTLLLERAAFTFPDNELVVSLIVGRVTPPLLQSITDLEAPRMVFGRVALLGDSAFVARPHVAAGTSKAALDAGGLVDALAAHDGDIDAALRQYERERLAFGRAIVSHARYLGAYHEAGGAATVRDPEQVLREYGAPHLVREMKFDQSAAPA
jgi:2-polyprenyl-6-methoxyphenol hydroxylase-like FAD-dependent oxidoreductase